MISRELSLFADLDQGRLVQGFSSTLQATLPRFVFGDAIPVAFRALKSNANNSGSPWSEVDLTGRTVRIAIGNPAGAATGGTFSLTYGANTTTALAFNAEGAAIQSALNALASITAAGGVVVTRASTGAFRIVFNTVGVRTDIIADTSSIYPSSGAEVRVAVTGSASVRQIVVARVESLPAAYAELTDEFPLAAATVTNVRTGSVSVGAITSLAFPVLPYGGTYQITIGGQQTAGIPWDADAAALKTALELLSSVGAGKATITGSFPEFTINFALSLGNVGSMTVATTALIVPKGRAGVMNTNTAGMLELLNGASQTTAKLEIEFFDATDATTWTVLQVDCTVIDDVIGNTPSSVASGPAYVTTAMVGPTILRTTAQGAPVNPGSVMTISGGAPATANGDYTRGSDEQGKPSYNKGNNYLGWNPTSGGFWSLSPSPLSGGWSAKSTSNVATPDLATGWVRSDTLAAVPGFAVTSASTPILAIGQMCRVGDGPTYTWYRAETLTSWVLDDGYTINVKSFGATGDGVTDDTAAIQLAILAAVSTGINEVYFPKGIFKCNLLIPFSASGIRLVGAGCGSLGSWSGPSSPVESLPTPAPDGQYPFTQWVPNSNALPQITFERVNGITIEHIEMRGNGAGTSTVGVLLDSTIYPNTTDPGTEYLGSGFFMRHVIVRNYTTNFKSVGGCQVKISLCGLLGGTKNVHIEAPGNGIAHSYLFELVTIGGLTYDNSLGRCYHFVGGDHINIVHGEQGNCYDYMYMSGAGPQVTMLGCNFESFASPFLTTVVSGNLSHHGGRLALGGGAFATALASATVGTPLQTYVKAITENAEISGISLVGLQCANDWIAFAHYGHNRFSEADIRQCGRSAYVAEWSASGLNFQTLLGTATYKPRNVFARISADVTQVHSADNWVALIFGAVNHQTTTNGRRTGQIAADAGYYNATTGVFTPNRSGWFRVSCSIPWPATIEGKLHVAVIPSIYNPNTWDIRGEWASGVNTAPRAVGGTVLVYVPPSPVDQSYKQVIRFFTKASANVTIDVSATAVEAYSAFMCIEEVLPT